VEEHVGAKAAKKVVNEVTVDDAEEKAHACDQLQDRIDRFDNVLQKAATKSHLRTPLSKLNKSMRAHRDQLSKCRRSPEGVHLHETVLHETGAAGLLGKAEETMAKDDARASTLNAGNEAAANFVDTSHIAGTNVPTRSMAADNNF